MAHLEVQNPAKSERTDKGATVVEYAVMLSFIILVCYVALANIGTTTNSNFNPVDSALN